jgi:hypothetical protein
VTTQKNLEKIPYGISVPTQETCYSSIESRKNTITDIPYGIFSRLFCVVTDIPDGMFSRLFCVVTDIPDGIFSRLF